MERAINDVLRHFWAVALLPISLVCINLGANPPVTGLAKEPFWARLLYAHVGAPILLSVGSSMFAGLVIWLFAIYLPERKKRDVLRNNLSRRYRWFRQRILTILLFGVQREDGETIPSAKELENYLKFRDFFGKNEFQHLNSAIDWLGENPFFLSMVLKEIEVFSQALTHTWYNCGFQDKAVHDLLGSLATMGLEYRITNPSFNKDHLTKFLWGIFAQWSYPWKFHEKDVIQTMIDEI